MKALTIGIVSLMMVFGTTTAAAAGAVKNDKKKHNHHAKVERGHHDAPLPRDYHMHHVSGPAHHAHVHPMPVPPPRQMVALCPACAYAAMHTGRHWCERGGRMVLVDHCNKAHKKHGPHHKACPHTRL